LVSISSIDCLHPSFHSIQVGTTSTNLQEACSRPLGFIFYQTAPPGDEQRGGLPLWAYPCFTHLGLDLELLRPSQTVPHCPLPMSLVFPHRARPTCSLLIDPRGLSTTSFAFTRDSWLTRLAVTWDIRLELHLYVFSSAYTLYQPNSRPELMDSGRSLGLLRSTWRRFLPRLVPRIGQIHTLSAMNLCYPWVSLSNLFFF